jgi:hypothetical protein
MRVVKLTRFAKGSFIQALRRLGRVPAAPRDHQRGADRLPTTRSHLQLTVAKVCELAVRRKLKPDPDLIRGNNLRPNRHT